MNNNEKKISADQAVLEDLIQQQEAADAPDPQPLPRKRKSSKCHECGKRNIDKRTQGIDSTMCTVCFEYAGWENTHSDNGHDQEWGETDPECPVCFETQQSTPEVKITRKGHANRNAAGKQFSHKMCGHPLTRKARQECRDAMRESDRQTTDEEWVEALTDEDKARSEADSLGYIDQCPKCGAVEGENCKTATGGRVRTNGGRHPARNK